jgi:UDP-N-acetylmuramate dehydrogenase
MSWLGSFREFAEVDADLSAHTTFRIGGRARWLFRPRTLRELQAVLSELAARNIPWHVLGKGANLLIPDAGVDAAVLHLVGLQGIVELDSAGRRLRAWAGTPLPQLVRRSVELGWAGLQGLVGIPGTLGGAVAQNAGGAHGAIGDVLGDVLLLHPDGRLLWHGAADLGLGYRTADLRGAIVIQADLRLGAGDGPELRRQARAVLGRKQASQPLSLRSAGCIFKNPPGSQAGRLIEESGLKGRCRGAAFVSPLHANFIVNGGGARSRDVLALIEDVRETVARRTGLGLELEVKLWPEGSRASE